MHAQHFTEKTTPRLAGYTKGRIPWISQQVVDAIKAAGPKGATNMELVLITGLTRRSVNESACNTRSRTGLIYSLGETKKHYVRHFWHEVPRAEAEALMERIKADLAADAERRYRESHALAKSIEKAKRKNDEERIAALMAEKVRRAEERQAIKRQKAAEIAAAKKTRAETSLQRKLRANNEIANRFRGTASPKERAREVTIVWPEHVKVQVCKGWTPRFEGIQAQGEIAKEIGRYSVEASTWAKAVAA